MTDDDPLAAVRRAGRKFHRAQAARDAARDELVDAIRAAHDDDGVQPIDLIKASGFSRQTVFTVLKSKPDPEEQSHA